MSLLIIILWAVFFLTTRGARVSLSKATWVEGVARPMTEIFVGCFSNGRLHPTKAAYLGCHVIKRR